MQNVLNPPAYYSETKLIKPGLLRPITRPHKVTNRFELSQIDPTPVLGFRRQVVRAHGKDQRMNVIPIAAML